MTSPFAPAHAKKIGWRFFPAECIDTGWRPYQRPSNEFLEMCYSPSGERAMSVFDAFMNRTDTRPLLQDFGQKLAAYLGGSFFLGPDKTREQVLASLLYGGHNVIPGHEENDIYGILDFRRGCLLVEDNHALVRARKKLREITDHDQNVFAEVRDLYSRPAKVPLRGLYTYANMPNSEVVEIQIHTRPYWEEMVKNHGAYEAHRELKAQRTKHELEPFTARMNWSQGKEHIPLSTEWDDEARGLSRRARATRLEAVEKASIVSGATKLELKDKDYQGDCSFPRRPAVVAGQSGYMIAEGYLGAFVKEGYPWHDPSWNYSQGKRDPEPDSDFVFD